MKTHQVDGSGQYEAGNTSDNQSRAESSSDTASRIGKGHREDLQDQGQGKIYGNYPFVLEDRGKYGVVQH